MDKFPKSLQPEQISKNNLSDSCRSDIYIKEVGMIGGDSHGG